MYWDARNEDLVCQWLSASTLQQFQIYTDLYKSIRYMASSILQRYFVHTNDFKEIMEDAINHLYVNLHHFNPQKGHSAFSYCQTILKNYYHGVSRSKGKVHAVRLEYVDIETPEFEYSYTYEPFNEEEIDFNPVFKRLETARFTLLSYLSQHKRLPSNQRQKVQREIDFLSNTQEYLYQYRDSQGLTAKAIQEYNAGKLKTKECNVQKLMKKHLGISAGLTDGTTIVEDRWALSIIDDDDCPGETYYDRNEKRRIISMQHE